MKLIDSTPTQSEGQHQQAPNLGHAGDIVGSVFFFVLPARRFRSSWMTIVPHSAGYVMPPLMILGLVLCLAWAPTAESALILPTVGLPAANPPGMRAAGPE